MASVTDHNNPTSRPVLVPQYSSINPNFQNNHHPQPQGFVSLGYLNPAVIAHIELSRSNALRQLIIDEGLVPSQEEEQRRNNVIWTLREVVMGWIKKIANRRRPEIQIRAASATILTYGSYGLGVHNAESDIDALCVVPRFANLKYDFFIVLRNMLEERIEVSDIQCVKFAKVPLMRFKFDGISIDLPYAQLQVAFVPKNVNVFNPLFLNRIDDTSWKSLSGVRANNSILRLVPDVKIFQDLLRCVKLWAKRRGVYGNLFGFLGGIHLAVLSAFVCQRNPHANLAVLVLIFFKTFAFWQWPTPVIIQGTIPPRHLTETRSPMAIQLPSSLREFCHSNITKSTFMKIRNEFRRGYRPIPILLEAQFDWRYLFQPFPYSKFYQSFLKVTLSTCKKDELADWVGCVKSRFRCLIVKLEELNAYCDPNPAEYNDTSLQDPNVVFYWGLDLHKIDDHLDPDSVLEEFKKKLGTGLEGPKGKITISVIQTSQLPKTLQHVDT